MTDLIGDFSPRETARPLGPFGYLLVAATAIVLTGRAVLSIRAEAAATASGILNSEPVVRMGLAANLLGATVYGFLVLALHYAFAPMRLSFALLHAYFRILAGAAGDLPMFVHLAPLILKLALLDLAHAAHSILGLLF